MLESENALHQQDVLKSVSVINLVAALGHFALSL